MEPITLDRYLTDPDLDRRLHAAARRARNLAMHRLLAALVERLTPRAQAGAWLARLG